MMHDGLKTAANYLLGRKAFDTAGDNLLSLYNTLQDPAKMNKFKYHTKDTMILGDFWKFEDSKKYWEDYFGNKNIDWADVKYPSLMSGYGVSNSFNWSSDVKSILDLYD